MIQLKKILGFRNMQEKLEKYVTMTKEYKIDDRFLPSNSFGTHLLTLKGNMCLQN